MLADGSKPITQPLIIGLCLLGLITRHLCSTQDVYKQGMIEVSMARHLSPIGGRPTGGRMIADASALSSSLRKLVAIQLSAYLRRPDSLALLML